MWSSFCGIKISDMGPEEGVHSVYVLSDDANWNAN
jgi:hypothetical protein